MPTITATSDGIVAYGSTPSDASVIAAIEDLNARGIKVVFCPFILMDIPSRNALPNPYTDGASGVGQSAYPWRGRISSSPAAGLTGTVAEVGRYQAPAPTATNASLRVK